MTTPLPATHGRQATPRVLVLATNPTGRGGVQRATRALLHAIAATVGPENVGLLSVWAEQDESALPCRPLGHASSAPGEGGRVKPLDRAAYVVGAVTAAWRWRHGLVIVCAHPWLSPIARLCSFLTRAPFAQWAFGAEIWFRLSRLVPTSMHHASISFAISAYTAARMEEVADLPTGSCRVIYLPLEESPGALPVAPTGRPRVDGRYVVCVARMDAAERRKGVDTTIRALPAVLTHAPGLRFVVIGDGRDQRRLEALAEEMGVADAVVFLGGVSDQELATLYRDAEVFVMPSGQEGFGIVYLEAGRLGVPSIAGFYGGAPEAVADGVSGFVVPYGDVDVLADRMIQLVDDPELRQRMGAAARERALTLHSFEAFQTQIAAIVEDLYA